MDARRWADLHLRGEIRHSTFFRRQEREFLLRRQPAQTGDILCVEHRRLSVQIKSPPLAGTRRMSLQLRGIRDWMVETRGIELDARHSV
jgi:hypothetical protein